MNKLPALLAGVALAALPALGEATHYLPVAHEAEFAARSIIYDLAQLNSTSVRRAREHCGSRCGGEGSSIEVAIGLLGIGGQTTTQSLLDLLSVCGWMPAAPKSESAKSRNEGKRSSPP